VNYSLQNINFVICIRTDETSNILGSILFNGIFKESKRKGNKWIKINLENEH